jgi:hypothetical protein
VDIYAEMAARHGFTPDRPAGVEDTQVLPVITPVDPASATAGEQDHTNPWFYAGADADPPSDCGRPADG